VGERLDEASAPSRALDEAANAALIVAMMSPWYLESRWCKDEREAWAKGIGGESGQIAQGFGRTFVVRVQDTDDDPWPPEFTDAQKNENLGFWMYDQGQKFADPYGWIEDKEDLGSYNRKLQVIKQRLLQRLDQLYDSLKEEREARDRRLRLSGQSNDLTTVYVHARPAAGAVFDQTLKELTSNDFYAIPTRPEPLRLDGRLTDTERERLQVADALLVVGTAEDDLSIDMAVVGKHARNLAMAKTPKLLPGAVLDKIGTPSPRERLRSNAFIAGLRWLDGRSPGWTVMLRHLLRQAVAAESAVAGVGASG
jgi:hypothetical protein